MLALIRPIPTLKPLLPCKCFRKKTPILFKNIKDLNFSSENDLSFHLNRFNKSSSSMFHNFKKTSKRFKPLAQSPDSADLPASDASLPPITGVVVPAVAVACLGAILFGYHLGVVNGSLDYILSDLNSAGNSVIGGWIVSISLAGAFFGSVFGGSMADWLGRRKVFQFNAIPLIAGAVISATATSTKAMIIGRFLAGIGIGLSSSCVPLYISEVSPTDIRGQLGTVNQLAICMGILIALICGLPVNSVPGWWRMMFWFSVLPAFSLIFFMLWAPESPRWLAKKGRIEEAQLSMTRLWGKARSERSMAELEKEKEESVKEVEQSNWTDLFSARYRKVIFIGTFIYLFQQFAGINAIIYYSSSVFQKVGVKSQILASALVGFANVLGTAIATTLMDKEGRKKLLSISFFGMAISMLILSLSLSWKFLESHVGLLSVICTITYILSFSLGVGPVPALLLPEIFPSDIRGKAVSLCMGVHWMSNFAIGLFFLEAVNAMGVGFIYLLFSLVCCMGMFFVHYSVVETKGKSLEEIEKVLINA